MTEREDAISRIERVIQRTNNSSITVTIPKYTAKLVVAILKEQKAVKPRVSSVEQRCGNCNKVIEMDGWVACPWCGKPIDWESWWSEHEAYRRR